MTEFLLRRFVRGYDPEAPGAAHASVGKLAGAVGIACNCILFLLKLTLGLLTSSISIVADAMNNLTDASSSAITLVGFHMAQRPADKGHPYGHARYEYISGFVVATLILLISLELGQSALGKILSPAPVSFAPAAVWGMAASLLVKGWMARFYKKLGKAINSATLAASAADSRSDVVATSAVLLGYLAARFLGWQIDGWAGLAVAAFIFVSGVGVARETISPLLGAQADEKLCASIGEVILRHEDVLGIHDLLVHDYGPGRYFASVHVELSADEDPQACHDVIDDIECDVLRELDVNLVIHYDPVTVDDPELNEMRVLVGRICADIDERLDVHDLRMVRTAKTPRLVFDLAVPYEMGGEHAQLKEQIDAALRELGKNYRTVIRFEGRG